MAALPGAAAAQGPGLVAVSGNGVPGSTIEERAASYRLLREAGVEAVRIDLSWHHVEPPGGEPFDFTFERTDHEVAAIEAAGLRVIGLLAYGHPDHSARGRAVARTPLAGGLPPFGIGHAAHFPPDDPADFAAYARATADHYGDEVIAWEVWNEQNQGWRFWPPREDPAAYGDLLCEAHRALKEVDPATPVVFGGVFFPAVAGLPGMSGPDFVRAAHDARPGLGACYDALAYHPYPYPFTAPELDVPVRGSVLAAEGAMRAALPPAERGKPLWITEVGWPTHERAYGVSEEKQAQYLARTLAASFAQGVPVVTWYTYGDGPDPTGLNQEAWFGLFRADGSPKPAYRALAVLTDVLGDTGFASDLSESLGLPGGGLLTGGRGLALEFRGGDRRVVAVWLASESVAEAQGPLPDGGTTGPRSVRVSVPVSSPTVLVVDHLGSSRTEVAEGGRVELEAGPGPQYVVDAG